MSEKSKSEQMSLSDAGEVLFQQKVGSPVPGDPIAKLEKSENALLPTIQILESVGLEGDAKAELQNAVEDWLKGWIAQTLEPLVALQNLFELETPIGDIARKMHDAMGLLPREELEELIAQLDADKRRVIRSANIKLGPILVFMPLLKKPAAVRLKAVLWSLYHDKPLPAPVPNDGIVSFTVDPEAVDKDLYKAIGYPVYGPRAIRIDMLDRVISSIYDAAEQGKFQAQHQMAEWLGCNIDDLYAILESMGHKRDTESQKPRNLENINSETPEPGDSEIQESEKPDLDWFYLKRGKANETRTSKGPARQKPSKPRKDKSIKKQEKKNREAKKKRVMSAGPEKNPEDSPFAVLAQLKK